MKKDKNRSKLGFTLAEVLMVVAIMVILFALAIPALGSIQKSLRQKELDSKAETIYTAVQNKLSELYSTGNTDKYNPSSNSSLVELKKVPGDFDETVSDKTLNDYNHVYFFIDDSDVANEILGNDTLSEDLQNGHFVVEIIPYAYKENSTDKSQITAATVYAVYYSEDVIDVTSSDEYLKENGLNENYLNKYRDKAYRKKYTDARVGYYGGSNPSTSTGSTSLTVTSISITSNDVVNKAIVKVRKPISVSDSVTFTFTFSDTDGNKRTIKYDDASGWIEVDNVKYNASDIGLTISHIGVNYTFTFILDDLSSNATRFKTLYPNLVAGSNITLNATAECPDNFTVTKGVGTAYGNSIYAYAYENELLTDSVSTGFVNSNIAYISNPRHLQNLDNSSDVSDKITDAKLLNDISFKSDDDFYSQYSSKYFNGFTTITNINSNGSTSKQSVPNFKGIENPYLVSFTGKDESLNNHVIYNLSSYSNSSSGLFASVSNSLEISNVTLVGTTIEANTAAGGLIGIIGSSGSVKLDNVYIYLSSTNGDIPSAILSENNLESIRWISSDNAGGLVGYNNGSLTITNSFASTVIGKVQGNTGGLVGYNGGKVSINTSYSDSYLYGKNVSGFIGNNQNSNVTISSAYTAGFIGLDNSSDAVAAGFVNGEVNSIDNSYSVIAYFNVDSTGGITKNTDEDVGMYGTIYSTAKSSNYINNVYYSAGGNPIKGTSSDLSNMNLNTNFVEANNVNAYRLMGQSLTAYPCKILNNLTHYGDWDVTFAPGSLVYYEEYADGTYGFDGAGADMSISNLGTIVGDGYGVVFGEEQTKDITIKVGNNTYTIDVSSTTPIKTTHDNKTYYIYKLDKSIVNPTSVSSYYTRVSIISNSGSKYYDFNPHFARSVVEVLNESSATSKVPSEISIRSPRHLNNLSKYYNLYRGLISPSTTFSQERNMDYATYKWPSYSNYSSVSEQAPIGESDTNSFNNIYNGNSYEIGNISFVTNSGHYVGMFGHSSGTIKNVIIATQYSTTSGAKTYKVSRNTAVGTNDYLYSGILVGYNNGTINNCAVAGYYLDGTNGTIYGYENASIYVGGLVGYNDSNGKISNSSADIPSTSLNMYRTTCYAGGFVGYNKGAINNSYGLNNISSTVRNGTTIIAGFAAYNTGTISNSYCATALTSSGEGSYSYLFTPSSAGGSVSSSYYLYKGSFKFVDKLYSYNGDTTNTSGTYKTYNELVNLTGNSKAVTSLYHGLTNETNYPYRAVVTDSEGKLVHYGEWQVSPKLGTYGIFYWEKEENGQNNGYKITYIGKEDGGISFETTLCDEHDDGGVITEYGYGYYVLSGSNVTVSLDGISFGNNNGNYNKDAKVALESQFSGLTFYPFKTTTDQSADYIYLNSTDINGSITLKISDSESTTFYVSPFFGNALSMKVSSSIYNSASSDAQKFLVTSDSYGRSALSSTNIPGSASNQYEIRSADQLQYINWHYNPSGIGNSTDLVTTSNYKQFNYLIYTRYTSKASQTLSNAYNKENANLYFIMTHDINAETISNFVPIAGQTTSSSTSYNSILYTWFGSTFNGQSYKIQELNINSKSFTVGLFGVTVDANLKNIILYSSKSTKAIIQRNTLNTDGDGAYALGGLIGIAYNYSSGSSNNIIENCAIAGYRIIDNSKNKQTLGEANVGGLVGVANVNIDRCSAVIDIEINAEHKGTNGYLTRPTWGNYIRVGGISGAVQDKITNSYSGGSIKVTNENLLNETYYSSNTYYDSYIRQDSASEASVYFSTHIYIAGIAGSGFTMNYQNFTDSSSIKDGNPYVENCYTYMDFPKLEGTIRSITMITNVADRYAQGPTASIINCYYLESSADIDTSNLAKYRFQDKGFSAYNSTSYLPDMIRGSAKWIYRIINGSSYGNDRLSTISLASKSYAELSSDNMINLLGSLFHKVSTTDASGQTVDGKYSFPAGNSSLDGKNYPFPTVIQQTDSSNTYNLHYGSWPFYGAYFENGIETLDIFDDFVDTNKSQKILTLIKNKTTLYNFKYSLSNEDIISIVKDEVEDTDEKRTILIEAKKTGSVDLTVSWCEKENDESTRQTAKVTINVTADLNVKAIENIYTLNKGEKATSTLSATSNKGKDFSNNASLTWTVTPSKIGDDDAVGTSLSGNMLTLNSYGYNATVAVKASFKYKDETYEGNTTVTVNRGASLGLAAKTDLSNYTYSEANITSSSSTARIEGKTLGSEEAYSSVTGPQTNKTYYLYEINDDIITRALNKNQTDITSEYFSIVATYVDSNGETTNLDINVGTLSSIDENGFKTLSFDIVYKSVDLNTNLNNATITATVKDPNTDVIYYFTIGNVSVKPNPYSLTLNANGGSFDSDVTSKKIDITSVDILDTITNPTKTGYKVEGWYTDKLCSDGNKVTKIPLDLSDDLELYAKWEALTKEITLTNGEYNQTITAAYDDSTKFSIDDSLSNYDNKVLRYFIDENNNIIINADGSFDLETMNKLILSDSESITLTAVYYNNHTLNLYTKIKDGDSNLIMTDTVNATMNKLNKDVDVSAYKGDTSTSYELIGWFTEVGTQVLDKDGNVLSNDVSGITKDGHFDDEASDTINLYAHWNKTTSEAIDAYIKADAFEADNKYIISNVAEGDGYMVFASPTKNDTLSKAEITINKSSDDRYYVQTDNSYEWIITNGNSGRFRMNSNGKYLGVYWDNTKVNSNLTSESSKNFIYDSEYLYTETNNSRNNVYYLRWTGDSFNMNNKYYTKMYIYKYTPKDSEDAIKITETSEITEYDGIIGQSNDIEAEIETYSDDLPIDDYTVESINSDEIVNDDIVDKDVNEYINDETIEDSFDNDQDIESSFEQSADDISDETNKDNEVIVDETSNIQDEVSESVESVSE